VTSVLDKKYVRARSGWTTSARRSRRSARNPRSPPGSEWRAPTPPHIYIYMLCRPPRWCRARDWLSPRAFRATRLMSRRHDARRLAQVLPRSTEDVQQGGAAQDAVRAGHPKQFAAAGACSYPRAGTTHWPSPPSPSPCFCSLPSRMDRCLGQVLEKFDETLVNAGVGYMAD
jgi:hypothetical protein